MAAPVEGLAMYYEDSVNHYTYSQTPFNKRGAPVGSGDTTSGLPTNLNLRAGYASTKTTAGDVYYFHDEASDVAGYKKLLLAVSDIAKQNINQYINAGDLLPVYKLCGMWITEPGVPGFVGNIPAHVAAGSPWITYFRQQRYIDGAAYLSSWIIRWYRYYYDTGEGMWMESGMIAFTIGGSATNTETTQTYRHSIISSDWGASDRLVAKVWAYFEDNGGTV